MDNFIIVIALHTVFFITKLPGNLVSLSSIPPYYSAISRMK